MNRRDFTRLLPALGIAGTVPVRSLVAQDNRTFRAPVDSARLIERFDALKQYGATPAGGISRVAFSDADRAARARVEEWLQEAGCEVTVDYAGNLIGRRAGRRRDLPPLVIGSHTDSVPDGGNYDGQVGSMGAVEVVSSLADQGMVLEHPLEVVIFSNEEGGKTGSRALIGEVQPFELERVTASGLTIGEGLRALGGDPERLADVRRGEGSIAGFFELHVEQGGVLHVEGVPIGVVEGIVGIRRWTARIEGSANHAGTTPMAVRRDAMVAAAQLVLAVNEAVRAHEGSQVGTVGMLDAEPGAPNVIPGRVTLTVEMRALAMETIAEVFADLESRAAQIESEHGVRIGFEEFYVSHAAPTAEPMRRMIEQAADELGLQHRRMPSGAGHDAQSMARLGPIGMIFVPSIDGVSHAPRERTPDDAIVHGTEVLLGAVLRADVRR